MNGKLSIIIIVILVTAAILTVQSSSSMLRPSYAQSCPDGSTPDASGNCPTEAPPAGDGETAQAPPATETIDDGSFPVTPPPAETPPATETPPPATEAPPDDASQGATNTGGMSADWANSILAVHNSERAAVGVPPLVWSDSLAAGAQTWAEHLATTRTFAHASDAEKGCPCGENIASFSWFYGPTAPQGGGTTNWVVEKSNYVPGTPIDHGTIGPNGGVYGHYTQMVWRNEQEVGCGVANDGGSSILVCRYNLPGNIIGQAPY
jgi:uncharacterized protein YkwD